MKKYTPFVLLIIALLVGGYLYKKYRIPPSIKFEMLALTNLEGKRVKLSDYPGKKIFLNFFATWCGPCRAEFPSLDKAAGILLPDNFVFISISDEPLPLLNRFNSLVQSKHILILHSEQKLHDLKVFTVPTNYLLNETGKVVFEKTKEADWTDQEVLYNLKEKAK